MNNGEREEETVHNGEREEAGIPGWVGEEAGIPGWVYQGGVWQVPTMVYMPPCIPYVRSLPASLCTSRSCTDHNEHELMYRFYTFNVGVEEERPLREEKEALSPQE